MQFDRRLVAALARPRIDRRIDALAVDPELRRQSLEERDARTRGQFVVADEDLARERDARSFAAPGQELFAQLDQARGACRSVTAPIAPDQLAAALRDALEQLAKERGIHSTVLDVRRIPRSPL
jgi:hypothetical protein